MPDQHLSKVLVGLNSECGQGCVLAILGALGGTLCVILVAIGVNITRFYHRFMEPRGMDGPSAHGRLSLVVRRRRSSRHSFEGHIPVKVVANSSIYDLQPKKSLHECPRPSTTSSPKPSLTEVMQVPTQSDTIVEIPLGRTCDWANAD